MNDSFASKATNWDSPDKIIMTDKFVAELLCHVTPQPTWKVLEIGAGTGLVGLQISPLVDKLILEDTSESMLEVLKQKLPENTNVEILHGEVFDYTLKDIDMVFSCMAFHHIQDTEKTLYHLSTITKTGSWVVIGDLETEDGSFHGFDPIPHRGFDPSLLSTQFESAGFNVILVKTYSSISKILNAMTTNYKQFIVVAQRK